MRELLAALRLTVAYNHVDCLFLQVVQLAELVDEESAFKGEVSHQYELTHDAEGLQARELEEVARLKRLLRQRRVVDPLDEEQRQDVEEEIEGQAAADLRCEVLEVEQAVATCEVSDRQHGIEDTASLGMVRLLLVDGFGVITDLISCGAQAIALARAHPQTDVLYGQNDRQGAPERKHREVRNEQILARKRLFEGVSVIGNQCHHRDRNTNQPEQQEKPAAYRIGDQAKFHLFVDFGLRRLHIETLELLPILGLLLLLFLAIERLRPSAAECRQAWLACMSHFYLQSVMILIAINQFFLDAFELSLISD